MTARTDHPFLAGATVSSVPIRTDEPAVVRTGYVVSLCSDTAQFEALAGEWADLLKRAHHRNTFLTHQWIGTWWRLMRSSSARRQLLVLTARDPAGKLCGVLPLELESVGIGPFAYRILRLAGTASEAPEHLDIIVEDHDRHQITTALLNALVSGRVAFDIVQFTDLDANALLLPALAQWSAAVGITYQRRTWNICPYLATTGTFDAYFKTVSQKHRYKVRLFGRRLAAEHVVAFDVARTPAEVGVAIEALFRLHAKRWTIKDDDVSGFDNDASRIFHRAVAGALAAQDGVRIFVLRCDDRPVAACYCFLFDGRLFFYQPGWDPEFRQFHVGKILIGHVIQYCFEQGISEFDFLRGTEEYKFDWTDQTRETLVWEAGISVRGNAVLAVQRSHKNTRDAFLRTRRRMVVRLQQSAGGAQAVALVKRLLGRGAANPSKPTGASADSRPTANKKTDAENA